MFYLCVTVAFLCVRPFMLPCCVFGLLCGPLRCCFFFGMTLFFSLCLACVALCGPVKPQTFDSEQPLCVASFVLCWLCLPAFVLCCFPFCLVVGWSRGPTGLCGACCCKILLLCLPCVFALVFVFVCLCWSCVCYVFAIFWWSNAAVQRSDGGWRCNGSQWFPVV